MCCFDQKYCFEYYFQEINKAKKKKKTIIKSTESIQLNERFRQISEITNLKRFKHFSKIQQWSEIEQKVMMTQFVSAITSLLIKKRNTTIHCARAIMNFVMLAQYVFHDENILSYMKHALYRINNLKTIFVKYRSQNTTHDENDENDENEIHFNIFKLHVFTH